MLKDNVASSHCTVVSVTKTLIAARAAGEQDEGAQGRPSLGAALAGWAPEQQAARKRTVWRFSGVTAPAAVLRKHSARFRGLAGSESV